MANPPEVGSRLDDRASLGTPSRPIAGTGVGSGTVGLGPHAPRTWPGSRAPSLIRILLATDGSSGAGQALQLLASSFLPDHTAVEVLAVVPGDASGLEAEQALLGERRQDDAARSVREAAVMLRTAGFVAVETVRTGHAAETIVTHVIGSEPDLVLLGNRGLTGLRRQVVGSVSGKVARYAPSSVLVARTAGPIRHLALGYDASPDADEALDLVARLPLQAAPRVTVVSAYDVVRPLSSGLAPTMVGQVHQAYADSLRWAREAAEAMAVSAAARLRDRGLDATHRAVQGPAHEQLANLAVELSADVVVVGSRGLSGIQRFFLGSTSASLVTQPPASVLVARRIGG